MLLDFNTFIPRRLSAASSHKNHWGYQIIGCLVLILLTNLVLVTSVAAKSAADVRYGKYRADNLDKPFIQQLDILEKIKSFQGHELVKVKKIGESFQGRDIHQLQIGSGKMHVLLWSQMHGDEPTATASIFDVLNYIVDDEQQQWRASWAEKLTLTFVPMLNPDGAEIVSRFNAQGIDINRDARNLQTPEGRILMALAQELKPVFGFNLHDQSRNYRAGSANHPATISVLSPSYNHQRDVNETRTKAMQVIVDIIQEIQARLSNNIGRYDDGYSHRAFGDTLTRMGISTILFEGGGFPNDDNRQVARKAMYQMVLAAIDSIASETYRSNSIKQYFAIPMNQEGKFQDLIVRNVKVKAQSDGNTKNDYKVDLIVNLNIYGSQQATINEIGDGSELSSYHELDALGYEYVQGKAYDLEKEGKLTLNDSNYFRLLKRGVSHFVGDESLLINKTRFPIQRVASSLKCDLPCRGQKATFLLFDGRGIKFAVINGQVIDLRTGVVKNSLGT
ncbi:MAG: peptidase M14 [Gammaproteobacteria bacterium]|nr:peptidase M14 [Gammaproteobacteria bacterium]